mgnify:FL=1
MNRYQRRKYGRVGPPASSRRHLPWPAMLLAVVILLAVIYFRVYR